MYTIYDGLQGEAFLTAYFRDNGITEQEIELCKRWHDFCCCEIIPDVRGLAYAEERVKRIIQYRDMSIQEILTGINKTPWAWPAAMRFERMYKPAPKSNAEVTCILRCIYHGYHFLFGIGKDEVPITEDMRTNGEWSAYTFCN